MAEPLVIAQGPLMRNRSRWCWIRAALLLLVLVQVCSRLTAGLPADPSTSNKSSAQVSEGVRRLPAVHIDGTYFVREGKRFIPVGAHWVPAKAAMQWPTEWDPRDIEADFVKMHELGYNIVRLDMLWAWFEPRPGDYNPTAFQQLDYLV